MKTVLMYIAVVVMVCVGLAGCGSRTIDARLAQVNDLANAGEADVNSTNKCNEIIGLR